MGKFLIAAKVFSVSACVLVGGALLHAGAQRAQAVDDLPVVRDCTGKDDGAVNLPPSRVWRTGVSAVLDGDTFCAGAVEVRVADLDAPERGTPEGKAATGTLSRILRGQVLTCTARGTSFDRVVAVCRLDDGRTVRGRMIASGTAKEWTGRKRETPLPRRFDPEGF